MLASFHHFYQSYPGYCGPLVSFFAMKVEVGHGGCLKRTSFAIERFQFIMNLADVFLEIIWKQKGFTADLTLVLSFSTRVDSVEMHSHQPLRSEEFAAFHAGKLDRGV